MKSAKIDANRFWSKVAKTGLDACWEWTAGRVPDGYGAFWIAEEKRNYGAHVIAFLLSHPGYRLLKSAQVCHRCDNPPCCNPKHLFLGTVADNFHDSVRKGRRNVRLHPSSHHAEAMPRGEKHWATKRGPLNESNVRQIKAMLQRGFRQCDIMRALGIPRRAVQRVASGRVWAHVHP